MKSAGLRRRGEGGRLYDVFRNRVLFPIHDLRGEPVGFGGRRAGRRHPQVPQLARLPPLSEEPAALWTPPGQGDDRPTQEAVVVEGYFDVIACNRAGVETAVATCGTALGEDHFDLLRRFTDRVVLAFDSDQAGGEAALRGDELANPGRPRF